MAELSSPVACTHTVVIQAAEVCLEEDDEEAEEADALKPSPTALRPHELNTYRACAREFHETGRVQSNREGRETRRGAVHMAFILVVIVFCASLATGVTPLALLSLGLTDVIDDLAVKLALRVTDLVVVELHALTQPALDMCNTVRLNFRCGLLSSHLEGGLEAPEVQGVFSLLYAKCEEVAGEGIAYVYVGTEYGAFLGYHLLDDGSLVLTNRSSPFMLATTPGGPVPPGGKFGLPDLEEWRCPGPGQINATGGPVETATPFDPRARPWYVQAKAGGADYRGWTAPYVFYDGVTIGMAAVRSLRNASGAFVGVVGTDITLDRLTMYLNSDAMRLSPNMRHTVMEKSGLLIASSVPGTILVHSANGSYTRVSVLDPQQPPELRGVVQALQNPNGSLANTQGKITTLGAWYVYAAPLQDDFNIDWLYVMYVPTNDFLGQATSTTTISIGICVGVIVGTMLLALVAAWDLSARLRLLAVDMRRATSLALDSIRTQEDGSRVYEIQAISIEFCKLVNALRSFQKYLPQAQVDFLLSSNLEANLAALRQEITVMFLDLANFSTLMEALSDVAVIQFYGDIMTLLTHKVLDAHGTLDKYIGDAVMAFWNMPRRVEHHEQRAVEAALACRAALPRLHDKGWKVDFRIGINTGNCQVGNFGSRDRLNFTAIGDNVNVASRLEALCKAYRTSLLVSGTTHAGLTPGMFLTRLVDKVSVKGKRSVTVLHEVLGWRQDTTQNDLLNCLEYETAFQQYVKGDYTVARDMWERGAARGDATAQMMAERLRDGTPDPDGVWRWHTKA
eukprot:EG_transcript_1692